MNTKANLQRGLNLRTHRRQLLERSELTTVLQRDKKPSAYRVNTVMPYPGPSGPSNYEINLASSSSVIIFCEN